jgi:folate-binding protein YgfZ
MQGYEALRNSAALIDLSARGKIKVTGEDRARLLHAMSTNHIQQMKPGDWCYAFFLTAQGKTIADAVIVAYDDHFLLDVEPEARVIVRDHIDKFIIADDAYVEDVTDSLGTWAVEGPQPPPAPHSAVPVSHIGGPGWRVYGAKPKLDLPVADPEAVRVVRYEHFQPRLIDDIYETTLPMETGLLHGIHFSKGCYLGQEVVERVRSRGHVNRTLVGIELEGQAVPEPKAHLAAQAGEEVGKVTQAVFSPALGKVVGLAYVRTTHSAPGTELVWNGTAVKTRPTARS